MSPRVFQWLKSPVIHAWLQPNSADACTPKHVLLVPCDQKQGCGTLKLRGKNGTPPEDFRQYPFLKAALSALSFPPFHCSSSKPSARKPSRAPKKAAQARFLKKTGSLFSLG